VHTGCPLTAVFACKGQRGYSACRVFRLPSGGGFGTGFAGIRTGGFMEWDGTSATRRPRPNYNKTFTIMSCIRVLLAIIFPPLAVVDRGCGSFLIVFILTCLGWVPGVIAALVILNKQE